MNSKLSRRTLLKSAAGTALVAGVGMPAIVTAQADAIRIGHLTPLTGFLGPLGEYAVMGVKLAAEEINAAGGVLGRKIDLVMEDSVNPQTASAKAERLIERDKVVMIIGEISSASGLAIGQVANRLKTVFINTGCNSDALRGASCNQYMFHIEAANSMYVEGVGSYLATRLLVGVNPNKMRAAIGCTDGLLGQHPPDLVWLIVAGTTDVLPDLLLSDLIGRDRERHELLEGHAIFGINLVQLRRH
jgi:Periplasmic binding protein/TAT (twin-arginine translocation) pathway signal sequence